MRSKSWPVWPVWDPSAEPEILAVLRSGNWFRGQGTRVSEFEKRYAACVVFGAVQWDIHATQLKRKRLLETDPTKTSPATFRAAFSAPVSDFTQADVNMTASSADVKGTGQVW